MKNKCVHLLATAFFFFSYLQLNFAQAPNLGIAANFVLFSSTGAVGNTGISHFTGDIGSNSGAVTINVNVNGVIHTPDLTTIATSLAVLGAYNSLNATIATSNLAAVIGHGDTLLAGVNSIAGNAVLDSTLVLDAQGNPNAVFIFKVQGTLATADSAKIVLMNGALACNIFWKVDGAVSLVSGTKMKGTIIAGSAAIDLGAGVELEGRALTSTAGAIITNGVLAYTPTGCGSPVHLGPALPPLGSAANFAVFSGNGSVINAGITNITGDVGTNVGLTAGFDALHVTGAIHLLPDALTALSLADLLVAYSYLNLLPADIELVYPAQFGNNLVLTPHTYILNAATALTDTVILNGEGNANAVFVMKIKGAFSTSTHAKVVLTNGTQAKNVFWNVDGAVGINDYTDMQGTVISNNGAINVNTGVNVNGRVLTTNGALSISAAIIINPSGGSAVVLPVSLLYFKGVLVQENTLLEWATATEQNSAYFQIEQSIDQKIFTTVGTVNATGTSTANKTYSFTDKSAAALGASIIYYRLKSVDIDGKFTYSNTVAIKLIGKTNSISLYPNPVKENTTMMISVIKADRITYNIIDFAGKVLRSTAANLNAGTNTLNINATGLAAGVYNIIVQGEQTNERIKFIKE